MGRYLGKSGLKSSKKCVPLSAFL